LLRDNSFICFAFRPVIDTLNDLVALYSVYLEIVNRANQIVSGSIAAGGTEPTELKDYGFMQQRTIEYFDGNTRYIYAAFFGFLTQDNGEENYEYSSFLTSYR